MLKGARGLLEYQLLRLELGKSEVVLTILARKSKAFVLTPALDFRAERSGLFVSRNKIRRTVELNLLRRLCKNSLCTR